MLGDRETNGNDLHGVADQNPCMEHLYNGILSTSYVSHRLEPMHGTDVHIHICLGSSEDLTCYMYVASCESHVGSAYTMVCEDVKP